MQTMHIVQVDSPDNMTLRFMPDTIHAAVGDRVQFQYNPMNHSVVQAAFDTPCQPLMETNPNATNAFFSGFMPAASTEGTLTFTIDIMDEMPKWYYCSQGRHCQGGMVGVINPPAAAPENNVDSFRAKAAGVAMNVTPGQSMSPISNSNVTSPSLQPSSGTVGGGFSTSVVGGGVAASATSSGPAQQTVNAAPGRAQGAALGVGLAGLAAFFAL
ncbi:hypothetical protein BDY21DRAFT_277218 [Lineolata rhizophorae]|uniref:Uncharacterized protein n=1 Tax=Lineolata rhizophorae TaxID=578093 RepID=A0A6A6PCZ1_9PEZI|nr:hypothetical protein BDY21DRAFT_277218 [Lineolata rhizophorae]